NIILISDWTKPNIYALKTIIKVESETGTMLNGVIIEIGAITQISDVITDTKAILYSPVFLLFIIKLIVSYSAYKNTTVIF
ncbi:MAG: hypothetical protein II411_05110, partial [Lachnospiraceae bacterium]|nr:hypothetical protein [Lachnospiraceae bacterium]